MAGSELRIAIETTALMRPGAERGLGRYVGQCLRSASLIGRTEEIQLSSVRTGRLAEFYEAGVRRRRLVQSHGELFHATTPYAWAPTSLPTVTSILDVIPLDLPAHRKTGAKARFFYGRAAKADVVLTLSHHAAERIEQVLGVPGDKIVVAPLPVSDAFRAVQRQPPDAPARTALALVDLRTPDPRKRPHWIAPLAASLGRAGVQLRMVGAGTDALARSEHLVGLGRLDDVELATEMANCGCFVYFSGYEGQGLPPLEAMAAGAPVVAVANSAVTEMVEGAGELVIDTDPDVGRTDADVVGDLVAAVSSVLSDGALREELRATGSERASSHSDAAFTRRLSEAYELAACR